MRNYQNRKTEFWKWNFEKQNLKDSRNRNQKRKSRKQKTKLWKFTEIKIKENQTKKTHFSSKNNRTANSSLQKFGVLGFKLKFVLYFWISVKTRSFGFSNPNFCKLRDVGGKRRPKLSRHWIRWIVSEFLSTSTLLFQSFFLNFKVWFLS